MKKKQSLRQAVNKPAAFCMVLESRKLLSSPLNND